MAGFITNFRTFDFDYIGTKIGEQLRSPWAGEHAAEIKDFGVGEWAGWRFHQRVTTRDGAELPPREAESKACRARFCATALSLVVFGFVLVSSAPTGEFK